MNHNSAIGRLLLTYRLSTALFTRLCTDERSASLPKPNRVTLPTRSITALGTQLAKHDFAGRDIRGSFKCSQSLHHLPVFICCPTSPHTGVYPYELDNFGPTGWNTRSSRCARQANYELYESRLYTKCNKGPSLSLPKARSFPVPCSRYLCRVT